MKSYRSNKRVQKSPYQNVDLHQWKLRCLSLFHPRLPEKMDSHMTDLRKRARRIHQHAQHRSHICLPSGYRCRFCVCHMCNLVIRLLLMWHQFKTDRLIAKDIIISFYGIAKYYQLNSSRQKSFPRHFQHLLMIFLLFQFSWGKMKLF